MIPIEQQYDMDTPTHRGAIAPSPTSSPGALSSFDPLRTLHSCFEDHLTVLISTAPPKSGLAQSHLFGGLTR